MGGNTLNKLIDPLTNLHMAPSFAISSYASFFLPPRTRQFVISLHTQKYGIIAFSISRSPTASFTTLLIRFPRVYPSLPSPLSLPTKLNTGSVTSHSCAASEANVAAPCFARFRVR